MRTYSNTILWVIFQGTCSKSFLQTYFLQYCLPCTDHRTTYRVGRAQVSDGERSVKRPNLSYNLFPEVEDEGWYEEEKKENTLCTQEQATTAVGGEV